MRKTQVELAAINPDGTARPYNQYAFIKILNNDKKEGTVLILCNGESLCFDAKNLVESIKFVGGVE